MTRLDRIRAEFVDLMPKPLAEGVIYISKKYATASHNCCCGCGTRIVTPLKPSGWRETTENGGITLYPSVGNWSAKCQSHYWIRGGRVIWARQFSEREIASNRIRDQRAIDDYQHLKHPSLWRRVWYALKRWLSNFG